ncbi:hypothetical protein F9H63_15110 [Vibrio parahaemolyticus]|nr:hypothetical protein [Vibrio parahaemolyticus]
MAATYILSCLPKPIALIGDKSLVSLVNGLLQILSGFYIASMAAVATFQKEGMDDKLDGKSVTLHGKSVSRRQFLTYLFGYLAYMSILMYFMGGFAQLAQSNLTEWISHVHQAFKLAIVFVYFFFLFNILCTTVLGMHFMIDKIHREKITLNDNKKND